MQQLFSRYQLEDQDRSTLFRIHNQNPYRENEVVYASDLAARTKWQVDRAKFSGGTFEYRELGHRIVLLLMRGCRSSVDSR
ncbi:uncharacterized protein PHALS_01844 [Plasmopara halstedii]|uniref:Uncharacterized protein n=1 Tax=Plasmopara halstedii TaxID=4781 RepID=A0A0P1ATN7_PLAHL|nr:uncharacterized protein PHALS_01844 [Plasmopara halstedii]CEG45556.1 hypothetical protein PHALS_01844 [Plasmopara halstedii]|eukprot:XP_024581925.1 hypothetical protein PHALS_01844 [Plasmopara halstedii]